MDIITLDPDPNWSWYLDPNTAFHKWASPLYKCFSSRYFGPVREGAPELMMVFSALNSGSRLWRLQTSLVRTGRLPPARLRSISCLL